MADRVGRGRLQGKVAIVTGSSRGIGKGIALGFAGEGARVVITSRNLASLEPVVAEIATLGAESLPLQVDVSRPPDIEEMVAQTMARFGRIDVLVNNAGIPMVAPSEKLEMEAWQRTLDTNLTAVFLCSQAAGREMLRQGSGSIINIGSLTSYYGFPMRLAYATTKTGVIGITRVLAAEWADRGVRVNAIAPGWIRTDIMRQMIARGALDLEGIVKRTPMGRVGEVEDLVGPAVFLASADSAFVTGQTIAVDGGWLAYGFL